METKSERFADCWRTLCRFFSDPLQERADDHTRYSMLLQVSSLQPYPGALGALLASLADEPEFCAPLRAFLEQEFSSAYLLRQLRLFAEVCKDDPFVLYFPRDLGQQQIRVPEGIDQRMIDPLVRQIMAPDPGTEARRYLEEYLRVCRAKWPYPDPPSPRQEEVSIGFRF